MSSHTATDVKPLLKDVYSDSKKKGKKFSKITKAIGY